MFSICSHVYIYLSVKLGEAMTGAASHVSFVVTEMFFLSKAYIFVVY